MQILHLHENQSDECPETFTRHYVGHWLPNWIFNRIMDYLEWKADCWGDENYPRYYLTTFVFLVVVIGIPPNLFALTVIGWFPDLSEKPKHICQAYSLMCNLLSLCSSGFVVLSTFVPTHGTCSVVLCLVHYCLLTTFFAELLSHIDYYIAIVWPFFHEEYFGVEDRTLKMCILTAMGSIGIIIGFYMNGALDCREDDCPTLVTMAMSRSGNLSTFVLVAFVSLWIFMLVTSLHVFWIAIKTTRNNAIGPAAQNQEEQEEPQIQEGVQKLYVGIKKTIAKVNSIGPLSIASNPTPVRTASEGDEFADNPSTKEAKTVKVKPRSIPSDGHNDFDEGFIDECESTHSVPKVLEKSTSGSQDVPEPIVTVAQPESSGPPNKSLIKSAGKAFRFSLIHVLSYGMLIIPSLGYILCENKWKMRADGENGIFVMSEFDLDLHNNTRNLTQDMGVIVPISKHFFCEPDHLFFPRPLWQYMLLLFAVFRVAYPFVMIKSDSYLRQKINFIVSDDFEE